MDSGGGSPGMDRKRKMEGQDLPIPKRYLPTSHTDAGDEENDNMLTLSLSSFHHSYVQQHHPAPPPPSLPFLQGRGPELMLSPHHRVYVNQETGTSATSVDAAPPSRPRAARRKPSKAPREGKSETIPPAFPWSTTTRATVQSLSYLRSKQINSISNDVQCKKCDRLFAMEFNLEEKFEQIKVYIVLNGKAMCQRAPTRWMNPDLPGCTSCGNENCIHPVISDKKRSINWLFLLLGEMLGLLTLKQLKYFCKHTDNHRTGAKDRVLFLTYLGLCKQLDPTGSFDIPGLVELKG